MNVKMTCQKRLTKILKAGIFKRLQQALQTELKKKMNNEKFQAKKESLSKEIDEKRAK